MPNKFMQGFDKSDVSSEEAWELYLVATNDGDLYRQRIEPIIKNLKAKIKKGTYNETTALKLWRYAADDAAQRYTKEYDTGRGRSSFGIFTVPMRNEVAALMQSHYEEELRYATNPAKRIGAAHPKRRSAVTHAAPSKRLVRRRKANVKQGYYPNPIADKIALHFNAGNDTNGNPRRIFVVVDTRGSVLGAFDEGYSGESAVTKHYPGIAIVGRFDITPAQRKTLLKDYGK